MEVCEPGLPGGDGEGLDGLLVPQLGRHLQVLQQVLLVLLLHAAGRDHHLYIVIVLHMRLQVDVAVESGLALGAVPGLLVPVLLAVDHLEEAGHGALEYVGEGGCGDLRAVVAGHVLLEVAGVLEGSVAVLADVGLAGVPVVDTVS